MKNHYNKALRKPGEPEPTIYLSRTVLHQPVSFSLRLSFWDSAEDGFKTTEILDMGEFPEQFIHYPNDTCFQLEPDFVFQISKLCGRDLEAELERLIWPFVDPSVQRKMEHFFHPRDTRPMNFKAGKKLLSFDGTPPHPFDQRRLHFLRFGSTDQGRVFRMPHRLQAKLLNRSRDELEQYFLEEEGRLREHELKSYLYAALNLQAHFDQAFARSIPQALPPEEIDEAFLREFCNLNQDKQFWQERADYNHLPDYMIRYLILFFDSTFPRQRRGYAQAQEFMDDHRQFRWPERKNRMGSDAISTIFAESEETLRKADKQEITRLYRQKAKNLHPDTGGDHEQFVRLTEAYEELLRSKN